MNKMQVHRFGCSHWIEIFAKEHDLAAGSTQEDNVVLTIGQAGGPNHRFRLDLGDRAFRIGHGIHGQLEEAEIFHR